jgi:hypothetical protein
MRDRKFRQREAVTAMGIATAIHAAQLAAAPASDLCFLSAAEMASLIPVVHEDFVAARSTFGMPAVG